MTDPLDQLDPLVEAMLELRGNEAFGRFTKELVNLTCMVDHDSSTGDQALKAEGQRSIVITIVNMMKELENE